MRVRVEGQVNKLPAKVPAGPVVVVDGGVAEERKGFWVTQSHPGKVIDLVRSEHKSYVVQLKTGRAVGGPRFEAQYLAQPARLAANFAEPDSAARTGK